MNAELTEQGERIIRSLMQTGRYGSEVEVIDDALRNLETQTTTQPPSVCSIEKFQALQQRLFEAGLISEIRPAVRVDTGTDRFIPIKIEGEPLSETIIRERR